ncbi:hypothetical protein BLOT_011889 [Blomia tropicalis]|nr:hypothetical protein BLOT_011889 [Blomia tropicalis]
MINKSFWPCDSCDEVVYCSLECERQKRHQHKQLECGFSEFFRQNLTPLGAILFQIYSRLVMNPEYSTENDLVDRVSLSTDADLFFAGRENLAQLPKRSYQYRYYLLSNEDAGRKTFSCNHKLIAFEAVLALRESADNKDEILPMIASTKLIEQVLIESLQVMFALDINNNSIKESFEMDHFRLLSIIEDYKRLYRLNSAQGIVPEGIKSSLPHFVQPIIGTFFWPGCSANVKMTLCPNKWKIVLYNVQTC